MADFYSLNALILGESFSNLAKNIYLSVINN